MPGDKEPAIPLKRKRKRTIIPPDDVDKLERLYLREQWPSRLRKEDLAQELGQAEHFVSVWFQNRRARQKREEFLSKQQTLAALGSLQSTSSITASQLLCSAIQTSVNSIQHVQQPESQPALMSVMKACGTSSYGSSTSQSIQNVIVANQETPRTVNTVFKVPTELRLASTPGTSFIQGYCNQNIALNSRNLVTKNIIVANANHLNSDNRGLLIEPGPSGCRFIRTVDSTGMGNKHKVMKILVKPKSSEDDKKQPFLLAKHLTTATVVNNIQLRPSSSIYSTATCSQPSLMLATNDDSKNQIKDEKQSEESMDDVSKRTDEYQPVTFFKTIINMMCIAEGGIMDKSHQDYNIAMNDALYGINVNRNMRLVYDKETGLEFLPMQK